MKFRDRHHAGDVLGEAVARGHPESPLVAALPRGGVPVGYEVARALACPLDLLLVRKIGMPGHPELAIGAVAEGDIVVVNDEVVEMAVVDSTTFDRAAAAAVDELDQRVARYRSVAEPLGVEGRTVLVVDDGLATGSTARAAIQAIRLRDPAAVWVCVPVAPPAAIRSIRDLVDRSVVLHQPRRFIAVGAWYQDFTQTTDSEVRDLLRRSRSG